MGNMCIQPNKSETTLVCEAGGDEIIDESGSIATRTAPVQPADPVKVQHGLKQLGAHSVYRGAQAHSLERYTRFLSSAAASTASAAPEIVMGAVKITEATSFTTDERRALIGVLERSSDRIEARQDYDIGNRDYVLGIIKGAIVMLSDDSSPLFWGHIAAVSSSGEPIPAAGYFDSKNDQIFLEPGLKGSTVSPITLASALTHEVKHRLNSTAHIPSWWEEHNPFSSEPPPLRDPKPIDDDEPEAYAVQGAIYSNPGNPEDALTEEVDKKGTRLNDLQMAQTIAGDGYREMQTALLKKLNSIDESLSQGEFTKAKQIAASLDSRVGRKGAGLTASLSNAVDGNVDETSPSFFVIPPESSPSE